jgi:hypothetical protein
MNDVTQTTGGELLLFDDSIKTKVHTLAGQLAAITAIDSAEKKRAAEQLLKNARSTVKAVEDMRKGFTRQLDEKKAQLMDLEKDLVLNLNTALTAVTSLVNIYNTEQERLRQLELKRITDQQAEERRLAVQAEQEKGQRKQKVTNLEINCTQNIAGATLQTIEGVIKTLENFQIKEAAFGEFVQDAEDIRSKMIAKAKERQTVLKAAADNPAAAALVEDSTKELQQIADAAKSNLANIQASTEEAISGAYITSDLKTQAASQMVPAVTGVKKVWAYEVTDPAAVPAEYLTPDLVKIKDAVKNGAREIAGVRIFQDIQRTGR